MGNAIAPIQWQTEAIWEAVSPLLPGFTVEVLPAIDSTNSELMRRAKAGRIEPILLVAEKQTAGRGRLGRDWHDLVTRQPDATTTLPALTFSLGLPLALQDWSGLSLAVGVSVAHSLHPDIRLKWPNDLWLNERKLAGILIETASFHSQRYVVIGIGINLCQPEISPQLTHLVLRTPPAGLQELRPDITAPQALQHVALPLVETILIFQHHGFEPFQARFNSLDVLRGRQVKLDSYGAPTNKLTLLEGIAHGVNKTGALQIQADNGMQLISSAEVSVRPR